MRTGNRWRSSEMRKLAASFAAFGLVVAWPAAATNGGGGGGGGGIDGINF